LIYNIPHVRQFGNAWSGLKIQWETVHAYPQPSLKNSGSLFVYLDPNMLQYIYNNNTPEAFQWMCGAAGTIIWGVFDRKNPTAKVNKLARMPLILIGGNQVGLDDADSGNKFHRVQGMSAIWPGVTPRTHPYYWHRIWCMTKLPHGQVSAPHDSPHGPAYMPILDVSSFRRSKNLNNLYFPVP